MQQPAKCSSAKGLLLVEAVLSAVIIATGLIFVTRGLSTPLRALQAMGQQGVGRSLAQRKLLELELTRLLDRPVPADREGTFPTPDEGYRWKIAVKSNELEELQEVAISLSEVSVTVQRIDEPSESARFSSVWQSEWIPEAWQ